MEVLKMADNNTNNIEECFRRLIDLVDQQRQIIHRLTEDLMELKHGSGGGGTGNGFEVYESGKEYKRYQALIDPNTDIAYLVVPYNGGTSYTSVTVQQDCADGNLKLLGYDSQIVTFDHSPTPTEVNALPENVTVVEYNPSDTPYSNILTNDNED